MSDQPPAERKAKRVHQCKLIGCDGTRLGHELARDFPEETRHIDEAFQRLAEPKDGLRVNPENLEVP